MLKLINKTTKESIVWKIGDDTANLKTVANNSGHTLEIHLTGDELAMYYQLTGIKSLVKSKVLNGTEAKLFYIILQLTYEKVATDESIEDFILNKVIRITKDGSSYRLSTEADEDFVLARVINTTTNDDNTLVFCCILQQDGTQVEVPTNPNSTNRIIAYPDDYDTNNLNVN